MSQFDHTSQFDNAGCPVGTFVAACLVAFTLVLAAVGAFPEAAFADHEDTAGTMVQEGESTDADDEELYGDEKIEVDILADELKAAEASSIMARVKASATKIHTKILKARIPEQQARSDAAARNLYKIQQDSYNIVEMLLSSQSIEAFILQADYLHDVTQSNVHQIKRAYKLKNEAKQALSELKEESSSAEERVEEVKAELEAAQEVRIARAAEGIATAKTQAVTLGGKNSIEKSSSSSSSSSKDKDKSKGSDKSKSSKSAKKSSSSHSIEATTDTTALDDGADWSQSKEEFVAEWAPRIDAYLTGSPLYGQGENFAKSAWKYCIDPRWSAAISCTESSRGAICIRPHNAWGWGAAEPNPYGNAAEWGSWAEAIDAHARGLSQGYGYTITMRGAKTYCPVNWQHWYNTTLGQMALI